MNSLFPDFRHKQSWVFRIDWLAVGSLLAFISLFAVGLYSYQAQTQLIDAIASQAISGAALEAKNASQNNTLWVGTAVVMAGFFSFAILGGWIEARVKSRYQAFLTTLDFNELKRLAEGLETDGESRKFMIAELTRRQPGWSYA